MKYYKLSKGYNIGITEVDVEKETDSCVWINGDRNAKMSSRYEFHLTYDAAYNSMTSQLFAERETLTARVLFKSGQINSFIEKYGK